jgi:hypothetical protein
MVRKWITYALFSFAIPLIVMAEARSQTFDGITIIELADKAGWEAITGYRLKPTDKMAGAQYIVTFVSTRGSYTALLSGRRACVAWAVPGSYTGTSITFGLSASIASMQVVYTKICQPFTLTYESSGTVRIDVRGNKFHNQGPLNKDAKIVNYSRQQKVVADIPLVALNWGLQAFDRHSVKGVRLGPLPTVTASLKDQAKIKIGKVKKVRESPVGIHRDFEAIFSKQSSQTGLIRVLGHIATKEILGWPWDALYVARFFETLPQNSMIEAFKQAVVERYGEPSLEASSQVFLWVYDLKGQKLTEPLAAPDNCLGTFEHWQDNSSLTGFNRDIGPWGCALVMRLTHYGGHGMVGRYTVEAVSGYTLALKHFFTRLEEMREAQQMVQEIESAKPDL